MGDAAAHDLWMSCVSLFEPVLSSNHSTHKWQVDPRSVPPSLSPPPSVVANAQRPRAGTPTARGALPSAEALSGHEYPVSPYLPSSLALRDRLAPPLPGCSHSTAEEQNPAQAPQGLAASAHGSLVPPCAQYIRPSLPSRHSAVAGASGRSGWATVGGGASAAVTPHSLPFVCSPRTTLLGPTLFSFAPFIHLCARTAGRSGARLEPSDAIIFCGWPYRPKRSCGQRRCCPRISCLTLARLAYKCLRLAVETVLPQIGRAHV